MNRVKKNNILQNSKEKIIDTNKDKLCHLRENYRDPEQLGEWILEDFTAVINRLYPIQDVPDLLDQEAARHEAYARNRRLAFVGREDLLRELDTHVSAGGKPLVLTGKPGCGKSALLAEWVVHWHDRHRDDLIIQHYIGSTPDSADWQGVVRRILGELKRAFAITDKIPAQPDDLRSALNEWTIKAAGSRRIILVVDALNQLAEDGPARQLGWLPVTFPASFAVLVSSLPGESLDSLQKRAWPRLSVPLFARCDIRYAAIQFFAKFGKTPDEWMLARLENTELVRNALYLRAVLDELRQFGQRDKLETKASEYLSSRDLPELFDRILSRWHDDFGNDPEHPDIVRRSLCLIACARFGLSEAELRGMLGEQEEQTQSEVLYRIKGDAQPIPNRTWLPFYLAAENALIMRAGLLNFGHDSLREAVCNRWLQRSARAGTDQEKPLRKVIARYFWRQLERNGESPRAAYEVPWQYLKIESWQDLRDCLTEPYIFLFLVKSDKPELRSYWMHLLSRFDLHKSYEAVWQSWRLLEGQERILAIAAHSLGSFLDDVGYYKDGLPILRQAVGLSLKAFGRSHERTIAALTALAECTRRNGNLREAESINRRVLELDEELYGHQHPELVVDLMNLEAVLSDSGHEREAQEQLQRAYAICTSGTNPILTANVLQARGQLYLDQGLAKDAVESFQGALALRKCHYGEESPEVAATLTGMGLGYALGGELKRAEEYWNKALQIQESSLDSKNLASARFVDPHLTVTRTLLSLGGLAERTGRHSEAERFFRRALEIHESCSMSKITEARLVMVSLARCLAASSRGDEAEQLLRRSLSLQTPGSNHDRHITVLCLTQLSELLAASARFPEAETLAREALIGSHFLAVAVGSQLPAEALAHYVRLLLSAGKTRADVNKAVAQVFQDIAAQRSLNKQ